MKKITYLLLLLFLQVTHASSTGNRTVLAYGCHLNDDTCYVRISGAAVGGEYGCSSNSIRWSAQSESGDRWFNIISVAAVTGKPIIMNISGCFSSQPSFPTFSYGYSKP